MIPAFLSLQSLKLSPTAETAPVAPSQMQRGAGNADFMTMLASLAEDTAAKLKAGEAAAAAGVSGKASIQDVAEALMAAEHTLQASIAVRDKAVAAYLEISRMQI
jgi:flagellar hook-basal body complex protein FliE